MPVDLFEFRIAHEFGGICNLRYDDTNPTKRSRVRGLDFRGRLWLIGGWADGGSASSGKAKRHRPNIEGARFYLAPSVAASNMDVEPFYASDYFDQLYEYARN